MKEEDKEKWIDQLKEKLDGYSEGVPNNVWNSLEKRYDHKVVPLWEKWQSIAAVLLLAIASSAILYLWNISVPSDYSEQEQNKLVSEIKKDGDYYREDNKRVAVSDNDISDIIAKGNKKVAALQKESSNIKKDSIVDKNLITQQSDDQATGISDNNENISSRSDETDRVRNTEKNRKYAYSVQSARKGKKWSIALNSGGIGVNSTSNINGAMMRFSNTNNGSVQSDAMSSPDMTGNNYLMNKYFADITSFNTLKTKKKHYQPVTFGLSFKFDLDNDWAIETGLTYTYLYSKLESGSIGNIIHQQQSLKYVGVPLKFSRNLFSLGNLNLYGTGGGEVEKCISGKLKTFTQMDGVEKLESKEDVEIEQLQLSLSASLGVEYKLVNKMSIYAEPGAVYYFDDKSGIETIRNEHPLNFNIKLGLRFTFTK